MNLLSRGRVKFNCFYTSLLTTFPDQTPPRDQVHPPQDMATAADGTHPTGMHSCLIVILSGIYGKRFAHQNSCFMQDHAKSLLKLHLTSCKGYLIIIIIIIFILRFFYKHSCKKLSNVSYVPTGKGYTQRSVSCSPW